MECCAASAHPPPPPGPSPASPCSSHLPSLFFFLVVVFFGGGGGPPFLFVASVCAARSLAPQTPGPVPQPQAKARCRAKARGATSQAGCGAKNSYGIVTPMPSLPSALSARPGCGPSGCGSESVGAQWRRPSQLQVLEPEGKACWGRWMLPNHDRTPQALAQVVAATSPARIEPAEGVVVRGGNRPAGAPFAAGAETAAERGAEPPRRRCVGGAWGKGVEAQGARCRSPAAGFVAAKRAALVAGSRAARLCGATR